MYVNKCIKCGREFETKNPKRVICPDCLYPDKKMMVSPSSTNDSEANSTPASSYSSEPLNGYSAGGKDEPPRFYSAGGSPEPRYNRPQRSYNNQQGGYSRQGGYNRPNNYNRNSQGGYNRSNNNYNRQGGGYNRPQRPYNNQGGFQNRRPQNNRNNFNKRPVQKKAPKQLLVSKEQLELIEKLYKAMLPLPNPDCHEVIGEKIGLEPRKVFFGINLVRQKMMLPKLPFPKRKLAISPDQLFAIKNLYEPLLPLPPIGCHKIIAAQLKMDEWRVHVGIGLIRSQMGLDRWNQDRPDLPEEFKKQKEEAAKAEDVKKEEPKAEAPAAEEPAKPKRGRKPKKVEETPEA
ncbi:putative uncharacterized protein [Clostridium sp. CAG:768]|nr:putative uncharacterized protein [Clostridium sp. CAG:768]